MKQHSKNLFTSGRKVIVAFYASKQHGSDCRVGYEYIDFAARNGFDTAIISDLDRNDEGPELAPLSYKFDVVRIPSFIRNSALLYRFTDFLPQTVWHFRVAWEIWRRFGRVSCIWISTSSAQPWFPLAIYLNLAERVVWGPVGGGGTPPPGVLRRLKLYAQMREVFRGAFERIMFWNKVKLIRRHNKSEIVVLARTSEVQKRLSTALKREDIPLFPEFLFPIRPAQFSYLPQENPRFIWAGQDIARKDLKFGLEIFEALRSNYFPSATLDVYGCERSARDAGITYHGWVPSIQWNEYVGNGILILSSYREGLSTVLVEAVSHAMFCIATPVGAIPSFKLPNVYVLSEQDHVALSPATIDNIAKLISAHLKHSNFRLPALSFEDELRRFLISKEIITNDADTYKNK